MPRSKAPVFSQSREVWHAPLQHNARREKVRNTSKSLVNTLCGSLSLEAFPDLSESNSTAASVSSDERTGPTHAAEGCQRAEIYSCNQWTVHLKQAKTRLINIKLAIFTNNKYSKWYYKDNMLFLKRSK